MYYYYLKEMISVTPSLGKLPVFLESHWNSRSKKGESW